MSQNTSFTKAYITSGAVTTPTAATFSEVRNRQDGNVAIVASNSRFGVDVSTSRGFTTYQVFRLFLSFDIASFPNNTWSGTISITGTGPAPFPGATSAMVQANKPGLSTNIAITDYTFGINGYVTGASMAGNVTDLSSPLTTWNTVGIQNNGFVLNSTGVNFIKDPANSVLSVAILNYNYDYLNVTPPGTTGEHFNRYMFDGVVNKDIIPTLSIRYGISKINVDDVNGLNDIKSINGIDDAFIYEVNGIVS